MIRSFSVKSNDYMYILYVSSLIKSVVSLHNLIGNKIQNKELEEENSKKEKEAEEEINLNIFNDYFSEKRKYSQINKLFKK